MIYEKELATKLALFFDKMEFMDSIFGSERRDSIIEGRFTVEQLVEAFNDSTTEANDMTSKQIDLLWVDDSAIKEDVKIIKKMKPKWLQ